MGKGTGASCGRPALALAASSATDTHSTEQLTQSMEQFPGQFHAVNCSGSLFLDDALYFQSIPHRERVIVTQTKLSHLGNPSWCEPSGLSDKSLTRWRRQFRRLHREVIEHHDECSENDVLRHIVTIAPLVDEHLTDEQRAILVKRCLTHVKYTRQQPMWRTGDTAIRAQASVARENEQQLIEQLTQAGATLTDHHIELPEYKSVHQIQTGNRYELHHGDVRIMYTPHSLDMVDEVTRYQHHARYEITEEYIDSIRQQLNDYYRARNVDLSTTMVLVTKTGGATRSRTVVKSWWQIDRHAPKPVPTTEQMHQMAAQNQVVKRDGHTVSFLRFLTDKDFRFGRMGNELEQINGIYLSSADARRWKVAQKSIENLRTIIGLNIETEWIEPSGEHPITSPALDYSLYNHASEYFEEDGFDKGHRSGVEMTRGIYGQTKADIERFGDKHHDDYDPDRATALQTISFGVFPPSDYHQQLHQRTIPKQQASPLSEQGLLRIDGATTAQALQLCQELSLTKDFDTRPAASYADGRTRGRVLPAHSDFQDVPLRHPTLKDKMVLHGLTGAYDPKSVLYRLHKIHEAGGLKSIAERRHMNISVNSLSPLGDIASGLDIGVPCKIGDEPEYGDHIVFAMKPDVLSRRDIFFADRDYGGGQNRYIHYQRYAQKIGQLYPHQPPDRRSRTSHLDNGLEMSDNEAYLRHEIPWEHIDTIYVKDTDGLPDAVRGAVDEWVKAGTMPPVRVVSYEETGDDNCEKYTQTHTNDDGTVDEWESLRSPLQQAIRQRATELYRGSR